MFEFRVQGFLGFEVSGLQGFMVCGLLEFRVSDLLGFRVQEGAAGFRVGPYPYDLFDDKAIGVPRS